MLRVCAVMFQGSPIKGEKDAKCAGLVASAKSADAARAILFEL